MACTSTGIIPMDAGPITIGKRSAQAGFDPPVKTPAAVYREASGYCEKMRRRLLVKQATENGAYGWSARQATLSFKCLNADDPEYLQ